MNVQLAMQEFRKFKVEDGEETGEYEFSLNMDQLTSLATNPNSGLSPAARLKVEWDTHGVGLDIPTERDETMLYTRERLLDYHTDICCFVASGWTLGEVKRYIIQKRLGPWMHIFNVHSDGGDSVLVQQPSGEDKLIMPTDIYHSLRKRTGFESILQQLQDSIAQQPRSVNIQTRVRIERIRRDLPANTLRNIADHPALR